MNFTGENTLPNIARRNWQIVTLAGSLAVAVSLAAGLGAFETDSPPPAPAQPAASISRPAAVIADPATLRPVVYIVESHEQATAFQAEMALDQLTTAMAGYEVPHQQAGFVVIDAPERDYLYDAVVADQMAADTFDIVDLRANSTASAASQDAVQSTQPLPVVYIVTSQEQGLRLAEDIEADLLAVQGFDVPLRPVSFLVISTPEEEQALNQTIMEQQLLTEPTFDIIDMRR
jgi:hypothetical protein